MDFYKRTFEDLLVSLDQNILTLKLNNEASHNAITTAMIDSLEEVLEFADFDDQVRVIVLTGCGKSFCAGGDVKAMENQTGMFAGGPNQLRKLYRTGIQRIPKAIEALTTPIIAKVNGAAIGAGCDLAMMCDLRVACEYTKFAETFSKLSLVPGDGGTFFLQRVIGYTYALEMFLTGDIYSGDQILKMGLANFYVASEELDRVTHDLALKISKNAPVALSLTKIAMKSGRSSGLTEQLEMLSAFQGIAQRTDDHREGLKALKEKRRPEFQGF